MDHKHFCARVLEINQTQLTTISLFPLTGMYWDCQVFLILLVVTHHYKNNKTNYSLVLSWFVSTFFHYGPHTQNSSRSFKTTIIYNSTLSFFCNSPILHGSWVLIAKGIKLYSGLRLIRHLPMSLTKSFTSMNNMYTHLPG